MAQLQLKDFKMHYIEQGTGPEAIVFVHGFRFTQSLVVIGAQGERFL